MSSTSYLNSDAEVNRTERIILLRPEAESTTSSRFTSTPFFDKIRGVKTRKEAEERGPGSGPVFDADNPLALGRLTKRKDSPLNDPVWKSVLRVAAGSLAAWVIVLVGGSKSLLGIFLIAVAAGFAWVEAVRMLLLESKLKRFWIAWLALSLPFVLVFDYSKSVWITAVALAFVFLLFRKYAPYRHLTSKRRVLLFSMCFVAFILLTAFWRFSYPGMVRVVLSEQGTGGQASGYGFFPSLGLSVAAVCVWSLRLFFAFSMMSLFFRVRLHFLKIKPKLAVSALLLIMVPVLLLLIMEIVVLYSVLGESRAVRASAILSDWTALATADPGILAVLSGEALEYSRISGEETARGPRPSWLENLKKWTTDDLAAMEALESEGPGFYLWHDAELWIVTKEGRFSGDFTLRSVRVGQQLMDRLAATIKSEVIISVSNPIDITRIAGVQIRDADVEAKAGEVLRGHYPSPASEGILRPRLHLPRSGSNGSISA